MAHNDVGLTMTREAQLVASALAPIEEHIGPVSDWPSWLRDLALKDHLNVDERFTITTNLFGNVCPPPVFANFIIPKLRDNVACREVAKHLERLRDGYYVKEGRHIKYWDIALKTSLPLAFHKTDNPRSWDWAIEAVKCRGRAWTAASGLTAKASGLTAAQKLRMAANLEEARQRLAKTKQKQRAAANLAQARQRLAKTLAKRTSA